MERWLEEQIFFDGDSFFEAMETAIANATQSIDLETYIFENDDFGKDLIGRLVAAANRGIKVRIIVDGVGSWGFSRYFKDAISKSSVVVKIYHRLPWESLTPWELIRRRPRFGQLFRRVNNRNHRKICIIDRKKAWVGSFNIAAYHRRKYVGDKAWRDTGLTISGTGVAVLNSAFDWIWFPWKRTFTRRKKLQEIFTHPLLSLNQFRSFRRRNYKELLRKIRTARRRIWIANSYFVPHGSLLKALEQAGARGVDVRIIVPHNNDVFFIPWVSSAFYEGLTEAGVKIYEYLPSMFHAKTLLIDDLGMVGSSNLNHRSLFHDLEVDVLISHPETLATLVSQYERDMENSTLIEKVDRRVRPLWVRLLGKLVLFFRYWM
jgi:cardiolipin synthase A/B